MGKKQTLQDRLRKNKEQIFIGRESFLAAFKDNLTKGDNAKLIFNIHGNGGVGKTTLCNRFKTIASTANAIVVATDESTNNLLEWLAEVSKQLAAQNRTLKDFDSRYRDFQQEKKVIEADPEKPENTWKNVLHSGAGLLFDCLGFSNNNFSDALITVGGEWTSYLYKKITNKDNVELMLNPELVLSKLFWKNVYETSKDNDSIVFILDTYEATHAYLQTWLLTSISGKLGDVPGNISFVIAGRSSLTTNDWSQYTDYIEFIPLEPFSDEEANLFLDKKGITDPPKRADIIAITGRLPIFMVMLAANPDNSTYDTTDIIERFLKWIDSDIKKTLVLKIALLRKFNKDSLVPFLTEEQLKDIDVLFDWLIKQPFVQKRGEYWIYHDTVCKLMRTHERERSPKTWTTQQLDISKFYLQEANNAKTTQDEFEWHNTQWLHPYIEYLFHLLCADKDEPKHSQPVFIALLGVVNRQNWLHLHHFVELFANISKYPQWRELLNNLIDSTQINGINNLNALLDNPVFIEFIKLIRQTLLDKKSKHYVQTHTLTAFAFLKKEQYHEAIQDFQKIIQIDPMQIFAYAGLGVAYLSLNEFDEAILNFQKVISIAPNDKEVYFNIGNVYRVLNQFDNAISNFQKAIDIDPNFKDAYFNLGIAYGNSNQFDNAITAFQKTISIDPHYKEVYFYLGNVYRVLNQFENAIIHFQKAISITPSDKEAYFYLGLAYHSLKQFDNAIFIFQKAISIDPSFKEAYYNLGFSYQYLNQFDNAITAFQKAIDIDPNFKEVYYNLGFSYQYLNQFDNAITAFQKAIDIDPNFKDAYFHLGLAYFKLNQFDKAITAFQKAIDIDPNFKETYFNLGLAYFKLKQFENAIPNFQKIIDIDPNFKETYFNLGLAYYNLQKFDDAILSFQKAINIDPIYKEAYFNLGNAYSNSNQFDKAIQAYLNIIDINPTSKDTYFNLGNAYGNLNQFDKAIQAYLNVIRIEPKNIDAHANLGFYYLCIGDKINALQHIQQSINLGNNGASLMNLGHLSLIEQRENEAIEYYRQSLANYEDKAMFWEGMRDDAQHLTQYGITEAYYQSVLDKI